MNSCQYVLFVNEYFTCFLIYASVLVNSRKAKPENALSGLIDIIKEGKY